jgi:gliding motility-associated-like protein
LFRVSITLVSLTLTSLNCFGQVDLIKGLVGKYCLDGDAIDQSANQNHGTVSGATTVSDRFGNPNSAYEFDGINDFIQIPPKNNLPENWTLSCWYYVNQNPGNGESREVLNIGGYIADGGITLNNNYVGTTGIVVGYYYSTSATHIAIYNVLPPIKQWNHVAAMRRNDSMVLFINGIFVTSVYAPNRPVYLGSDTGIIIGARAGHSSAYYFPGRIDDVWVYNRPLSDEEISAIYNYNGQFNFSLGNDTTMCGNQTLSLDPNVSGATYFWSDSTTAATLLVSKPGKYWVRVNKYCVTKTDTIIVDWDGYGEISANMTICPGDSAKLFVSNKRGSVSWSTTQTSDTIRMKNNGMYWVKVSQNGCSFYDTAYVSFYIPRPDLGNDTAICPGNSVLLNPGIFTGTKLWSTAATVNSVSVSNPGIYWVEFSRLGCIIRDSIVVSLRSNIIKPDLGPDTSICLGTPFTLDAAITNGSNYLWSNGATTPSIGVMPSVDTAFWVKLLSNGCPTGDTVNIAIADFTSLNLVNDTAICEGDDADINLPVISGTGYLWWDGNTDLGRKFNNPGTYQITITKGGCSFKDSFSLSYIIDPFVSPDVDTAICQGQYFTTDFDVAPTQAVYSWDDGSDGSKLQTNQSGKYVITITTPCSSYVRNVNVYTKECNKVLIPGGFTPNKDGVNDVFRIYMEQPVEFKFQIYNRWGERIFYSEKYDFSWDGLYLGSPVQSGIYIYLLYAKMTIGPHVYNNGTINVIR